MDKGKMIKKSEVSLNIDADKSVLTLGDYRLEVSADGKKVVAYADDGLELKAAPPVEMFYQSDAAKSGLTFSLADDFKAATLNGVSVEQTADGHLIVSAPADSKVFTKPIDRSIENRDSWICIGQSVDTHKPLYVAPENSGLMPWKQAVSLAAELRASGETGVRLPTERELEQIFNSKAAVPDLVKSEQRHSHWSSTSSHFGTCAKAKNLKDGSGGPVGKGASLLVRLVRS